MTELVSVNWLQENLHNKDLILLDASMETTVQKEFSKPSNETIPIARYFDIKGKFSDKQGPFPNTIPTVTQFEHECQKLGINRTSQIVVFDNIGIYSSPRVWWLFKIMGHEKVAVLNGGLPEWKETGLQVVNRENKDYQLGDFKASFQKKYVKSYEEILENIRRESFLVVDARSEGRFNGTQSEPRKHLKSGHIPNSVNIPFTSVLNENKFRSKEELRRIFESKGNDDKDLVFSCGSGLTACIVMLASEMAFKESKCIYDGSWTEWAELQNLKVNVSQPPLDSPNVLS